MSFTLNILADKKGVTLKEMEIFMLRYDADKIQGLLYNHSAGDKDVYLLTLHETEDKYAKI